MPNRLLLLALVLCACAKKAAHDGSAAPASEAAAPESIDDLEAELERYEAELRLASPTKEQQRLESGAEAPAGDAAKQEGSDDACARVCDLATAICGLQDRICGLAAEHDGEQRYLDSCERATLDCDSATEACDACRG